MTDYSKARGLHTLTTLRERADRLDPKNRGQLISKLARLNHQKLLLERLDRVWLEQRQTTQSRLARLEKQIRDVHEVIGLSYAPEPRRLSDPADRYRAGPAGKER